jgi:hypothetical protein
LWLDKAPNKRPLQLPITDIAIVTNFLSVSYQPNIMSKYTFPYKSIITDL